MRSLTLLANRSVRSVFAVLAILIAVLGFTSTASAYEYETGWFQKGLRTIKSDLSGLAWGHEGVYLFNEPGDFYMGRVYPGDRFSVEKQAYGAGSNDGYKYRFGRSETRGGPRCFWVGPRSSVPNGTGEYFQSGAATALSGCPSGTIEALATTGKRFVTDNVLNCPKKTGRDYAAGPMQTWMAADAPFYYNVTWSASTANGGGALQTFTGGAAQPNRDGPINLQRNHRVKFRFKTGSWAVVFAEYVGWGFVPMDKVQYQTWNGVPWGRWGNEGFSNLEAPCGTPSSGRDLPPLNPTVPDTSLVHVQANAAEIQENAEVSSGAISVRAATNLGTPVTFEFRVDEGSWAESGNGADAQFNLGEGWHKIEVRARDGAVWDLTPPSRRFYVDVTPPETEIVSGAADKSIVLASQQWFGFKATERGTTAVNSTFECRANGGSWNSCTNPYWNSFAAGTSTFEVRAVDTVGHRDPTPAMRTFVVDPKSIAFGVDFAPSGSPQVAGYIVDDGSPYPVQRSGIEMGWSARTSAPVARSSSQSADARYDTFISTQLNQAGAADNSLTWEAQIPNGTYRVRLVAGDPQVTGAAFKYAVEGASLLEGVPNVSYPWVDAIRTVTVADGRLSITNMAGASNNKLSFVEVTPASVGQHDTSILTGPAEGATANSAQVEFAFASTEVNVTYQCRLSGHTLNPGGFTPCGQTYVTPALPNGGGYRLEVRSIDAAGNVDQSPVVRRFSVAGSPTSFKVNFQPSTTVPPAGFVPDSGGYFGNRGNGYSYGWICDPGAGNFHDQDSSFPSDKQHDTWVNPSAIDCLYGVGIGQAAWGVEVPNGTYDVKVVAGAPMDCAGNYQYDVNHVPTIRGVAAPGTCWFEQTRKVVVTDGLIGVVEPEAAVNSKLAYVEIAPATVAQHDTSIVSGPAEGSTTTDAEPAFTFSSTASGATYECMIAGGWVFNGDFTPCNQSYQPPPLPNGAYTLTVRSTSAAGDMDQTPVVRKFNVASSPTTAKVNFQPASSTPPAGFVGDSGSLFGTRGTTGYVYGWTCDSESPDFYDEDATYPTGRQFDTWADLDNYNCDNGLGGWAMSVPNGTYDVRVVAGSPGVPPAGAYYAFDVNGIAAVRGAPTQSSRWVEATRKVVVDNGLIGLTSGGGANGNRLAFIEVTPSSTSQHDTSIVSGPAEGGTANTAQPTFSFASTTSPATYQCELTGIAYNTNGFVDCGQTYTPPTLPNGAYTLRVRSFDAFGNVDQTPTKRMFAVAGNQTTVKINFQPAGPPPSGYQADSGASFGDRGNGYAYGWICDASEIGFHDANSPNSPDQRYDTYAELGDWECDTPWGRLGAGWGIAVPNGTYVVRVVAGAPNAFNSIHKIDVEGVRTVDGTSGPSKPWVEGTRTVVVEDGVLAVGFVPGSMNPALSFIEIVPASASNTTSITFPDQGAAMATSSVPLAFATGSGRSTSCKIDSGSSTSCTSPWSATSLSQGWHTATVTSTAPGQPTETKSVTFIVDTTAPDTTITTGPAGGSTIGTFTPTFEFQSDLDATFECKMDSGSFGACESPNAGSSLSNGSHTFTVRARDRAGNVDATPATRTFTVAADPPAVTIASPAQGAALPEGMFTPVFSADRPATFECSMDDNAFAACSSGAAQSIGGAGQHTFVIRATTPAGVSATTVLNVDVVTYARASVQQEVLTYRGGSSSTAHNVTAGLDPSNAGFALVSDPGIAVPASVGCTQQASDVARCDLATVTGATFKFANGNDQLHASLPTGTTVDAAGGNDLAETGAGVDLINTGDGNDVINPGSGTDNVWAEAGDDVIRAVDGAADEVSCGDGTDTANVDPIDILDDSCETIDYPSSTTITVGPIEGGTANTTTPTFWFTASESGATFECKVDAGSYFACTSWHTTAPLTLGSHTFSVRAKDSAGNYDPMPATRTFTVASGADTTAPSTPANVAVASITQTGATATWGASSDNSGIESYDIYRNGSWFDWTPPNATSYGFTGLTCGTNYSTRIVALDAANNYASSSTVSFTTAACSNPPVVTISTPTANQALANTTASLTFSANGSPTTVTCKLDSGAANACSSPASFGSLSQGSHTLTVAATNANGTGTASVAFTVDTVQPNTTITSGPANGSSQTATSATYGFSSTESGTFECKVDSAAYAACTSPRSTGAMSVGPHTFYVRAKDAAGNYDASPATRTITITASGYWLYEGTQSGAGTSTSLPSYGGYDWAHWGRSAVGDLNRKSPVASPGIGNYSTLGSGGTVTRIVAPTTLFGWTGGTPTATESAGTNGGLAIGGAQNRGFRVTIPAVSTNNRLVYVAFGVLNTQVKLTASISDGSIATVSDTPITNSSTTTPSIGFAGFHVRSGSANATLNFDIQQNTGSSTGAVQLYAVTVANE